MSNLFVVLWMIFFHIIDDYVLQAPCLCDLKQRSWWIKNAPNELYRYDFIWALIMHSFSWSFMIMFPIAYVNDFEIGLRFLLIFIANTIVHAVTDHVKANDKTINLWKDQRIHMFQIIMTAYLGLHI